jgi:glycosyltransferase involved in cell wall biosynthesis
VVPAYNSRDRIHHALGSLRNQDLEAPYEVIVVDSGSDGCADYVRETYPEARVIRSDTRLYPGAACNAGIEVSRGRYLAFLPDDCVAEPSWLRRRLEKHLLGFPAVGGAVANGTPGHPIGSADYYMEYSGLIPSQRTLPRQHIPHSLSYERGLFDRLGLFREDIRAGEDTLFAVRCLAAGVPVAFDARICLAHQNLRGFRAYLRHHYDHGRAYSRCLAESPEAFAMLDRPPHEEPLPAAVLRILVKYPVQRWWYAAKRLAHGRPRWLPGFVLLTPLIWGGLAAATAGQWLEWRSLRARSRALVATRSAP